MRLTELSSLIGGEILAKQIYDINGRVLLFEGISLSQAFIDKLQRSGVTSVYIEDEVSKGIEPSVSYFNETKFEIKQTLKDLTQKILKGQEANYSGIVDTLNFVIDEISTRPEVIVVANEIRDIEENIFQHCSNVCSMSVILGLNMGLDITTIKELSIGALFHDMGKIEILKSKNKKIHQLNEEELDFLQKNHAILAYEQLNKEKEFSSITKIAVLMHHEKCDGSGYPMGLKGKDIHQVAKIVAICDAFDNMVYGNYKQSPMPVYKAVEYLSGTVDLFDIEMVNKFISIVAIYPNGIEVKLNTGEKALVVKQNKGMPMRPIVRVFTDKNGNKIEKVYDIDLLVNLSIFLV